MAERTCVYMDLHNAPACTECGHDLSLCQCVNPDGIAYGRLNSPDGMVIRMVRDEIAASRADDPTTVHLLGTLMEKVGMLSTLLARHDRGLGTTTQEVLREAVQAAAMAIRVATEGDFDYTYIFPAVEPELPRGPVSRQY